MKAHCLLFLLKALGALPVSLRAAVGRLAGWLFAWIPTRDRRIAELQLELFIPNLGGKNLVREVYSGVGQTILEALNLKPLLAPAAQLIECPDLELVRQLKNQGRPILALTAHLSNWDLLAAWTVSQGFELYTIGREANNASLQLALSRIRQENGVHTIWRGDKAGLREMIARFKRPGVIAALIDQDTSVVSQFIPFMGRPARTPSSLIDLALKFDATIVSVFMTRTGFQRYCVRVRAIKSDGDTAQILSIYNEHLAQAIRGAPAQWVWFHKRWRSLSSERRLSSRDYIRYLEQELSNREAKGAPLENSI